MAGRLGKDVVAKVRKVLRNKKVLTVDEVAELMSCSLPTAHKRLKEWNVYTSYNKNARYYALPDVPKFDDNGIWVYKQIRFSKHGNLRQTLIHIITHSEAGIPGASPSCQCLYTYTVDTRWQKSGTWLWFSIRSCACCFYRKGL